MLYKLINGVDPFELNPGVLVIKEFKDLTPQQFTFVCLTADSDHDNPLRTLPERQRREKAAKVAGYSMELDQKRLNRNTRMMVAGKVESVEKAIIEYRANQFNEAKANLEAVDNQIAEARYLMNLKKEDICRVKKTVKDKKTGKETEKVYIDYELVFDLTGKASKLAADVARLVNVKKELKAIVDAEEPIKLEGIETYTSSDLAGVAEEDPDGEVYSTIDRVMAAK